jgi:uncharacterized protein YydD (DUF2326 family)
MLTEIHCEKFRHTPILFHKGLNVILGDDVATNSIGKSTLLMVIDFAMGRNSFVEFNTDVVHELGHHSYFIKFEFGGILHAFRRDTQKPEIVYRCTSQYAEITPITIDEYRVFLKTAYELDKLDLTFRGIVSVFSRIWGKENLDTNRPLDVHKKQKANDALISILKLYEKYAPLEELANLLEAKQSDREALSGALKKKLIPKINERKYKQNLSLVKDITLEIEGIKSDLARYATSIREIVNREVGDLKGDKDRLLQSKADVDNRLSRIQDSLSQNRHIRSRNFEALKGFFPGVYDDKIAKVEEFHSDIAVILKKELRSSERELLAERDSINAEIARIDGRISTILGNVENPGLIIDRVYELSSAKGNAEVENRYHEQDKALTSEVKQAEEGLEVERRRLLESIQTLINEQLQMLSAEVFGESRKSPYLTFSKTNYDFEIFEDTGTGKAYSNLILFDWAVFRTSRLPFLIHDSLLFKNIENEAVAKMTSLYGASEKQVFISIDEVPKYGGSVAMFLHSRSVIVLSDSAVLFIKDWREKT